MWSLKCIRLTCLQSRVNTANSQYSLFCRKLSTGFPGAPTSPQDRPVSLLFPADFPWYYASDNRIIMFKRLHRAVMDFQFELESQTECGLKIVLLIFAQFNATTDQLCETISQTLHINAAPFMFLYKETAYQNNLCLIQLCLNFGHCIGLPRVLSRKTKIN